MRSDQQTFRRVSATRRYLQVAFQILGAIADGKTPLGSRLPSDRELAEAMGVSRPTVREALLALEFTGMLHVKPGDGTFVAHDGSRSSVMSGLLRSTNFPLPTDEVLEARVILEPAVAAMAAKRATGDDLDHLRQSLRSSESLIVDSERLGEFVSQGLQFHVDIANSCHNSNLAAFSSALLDVGNHPLWVVLNARAVQTEAARAQEVEEHRQILNALTNHDAQLAQSLALGHIDALRRSIQEVMGSGSSEEL